MEVDAGWDLGGDDGGGQRRAAAAQPPLVAPPLAPLPPLPPAPLPALAPRPLPPPPPLLPGSHVCIAELVVPGARERTGQGPCLPGTLLPQATDVKWTLNPKALMRKLLRRYIASKGVRFVPAADHVRVKWDL